MNRGLATLLILIAVGVALYGAYVWAFPSDTFRYRLTITVESGGKVYTGSGVIQVKMHFQEYWAQQVVPKVTGDAVVVEVPGRAPVFVLLTAKKNVDWDASIAFLVFKDRLPAAGRPRERTRALVELREKREVPADLYPIMVAFGDISRPGSVYEVNPNDPSRALGPGSRVVRMTIEMTGDSVTDGLLDQKLPWVVTMVGYLNGEKFSSSSALAGTLHGASFRKRGI